MQRFGAGFINSPSRLLITDLCMLPRNKFKQLLLNLKLFLCKNILRLALDSKRVNIVHTQTAAGAGARVTAGKRGRSRIKYFFIFENILKPFNDCRSQIIMPVKLSIVYLVR